MGEDCFVVVQSWNVSSWCVHADREEENPMVGGCEGGRGEGEIGLLTDHTLSFPFHTASYRKTGHKNGRKP